MRVMVLFLPQRIGGSCFISRTVSVASFCRSTFGALKKASPPRVMRSGDVPFFVPKLMVVCHVNIGEWHLFQDLVVVVRDI